MERSISSTKKPLKPPLTLPKDMEAENQESVLDSAIFQLEMVHIELDKLTEKETEDILSVEQKYRKARQQCFDKRSEIIENIPDFWFNVFTSHPDICHLLHEDEEDCLHYLRKFQVESCDNIKFGYTIKFYFNENPYFKNELLIKEFHYKQNNLTSVSTKIDWKRPNSINFKDGPSNLGKKKSNQTFFGWFSNNEDASSDVIAEVIKDDIWVNSLQYYLVPDPDMEINDDDTSDSSNLEEAVFDENMDKTQRLVPLEITSK